MAEKTEKKAVKEKELAEMFGFTTAYLQNARWKGQGPPFCKAGRSVVYLVDDVEQWLKQNRTTAQV